MKPTDELNLCNTPQSGYSYGHEPVTPPTPNVTHAGYNSGGYLSGKYSQISPQFVYKGETAGHGRSHSISMASPQETSSMNCSQLSSPHTPLNINVQASLLGGPSFGKLSAPPIVGGSHSNTPLTTPLLPRTTIPAISGHSRSYSHNVCDAQLGLSRISLSSSSAQPKPPSQLGSSSLTSSSLTGSSTLSSSLGKHKLRPRAYSSGISPLESGSLFPAPLSSPVSPDVFVNPTSRVGHRPFSHSSKPSQSDDPFPGPLYRSLSSSSVHPITYSSINSFASNNRRSSPPYHTENRRRSSGSGSSMDSSRELSSIWGSNTDSTSVTSAYDATQAPIQIDLNNCTNEEIFSLCKDQRGCRFLQRELADCDRNLVHRIFEATRESIVSLMMDPFGNYLCQRLFEQCVPNEIFELLRVSAPHLPEIAVNQHGTRALQKLIDSITLDQQVDLIVSSLSDHVVRLIKDLNGNHVIQKLLLSLDQYGAQFIYDAVCVSIVEIGRHRHGCCVLQRCLDYAHDANKRKLVAHIVAQSLALVTDPFGNYVCQYVIDLGVQQYTDLMVHKLLGRIGSLSTQKFSSNVVEKCLRSASPPLQKALVAELMEPKTLCELLLDSYGNYVIQTALESTASLDLATKQSIKDIIYNALTQTKTPYGRRILSKLKS